MDVDSLYANGAYLHRGHAFSFDESDSRWGASPSDAPAQWHEDGLDPRKVQITPPPMAAGTLLVIATVQPTASSLGINDALPLVPDLFTPYLKYFCLQKVFEAEGESRDLARADYCRARWDEGLEIAKAIAGEDLRRGI
jgi:hypothetical protein